MAISRRDVGNRNSFLAHFSKISHNGQIINRSGDRTGHGGYEAPFLSLWNHSDISLALWGATLYSRYTAEHSKYNVWIIGCILDSVPERSGPILWQRKHHCFASVFYHRALKTSHEFLLTCSTHKLDRLRENQWRLTQRIHNVTVSRFKNFESAPFGVVIGHEGFGCCNMRFWIMTVWISI